MAKYTPLQEKLDSIVEQGKKLRRRKEYLERERDFLIDTLIDRPTKNMAAHRCLIEEWNEEIDRLNQSIEYLLGEHKRYREKLRADK